MKTVTGHFEWHEALGRWLPFGERREADNLVLERLQPDVQGISAWLSMEVLLACLPAAYRGRVQGNGTNMFNRGRGLGKDFIFEKRNRSKIVAVRSVGLVAQIERAQSIRGDLARSIRQQRCAVLATHQDIEVDHKAGRKNERRLEDVSLQVLGDFQPLNATVNDVKRSHCRRCLESHHRFDARVLGYSAGWWLGDERSETCNGCYWHDPRRFNAELSRGFNAESGVGERMDQLDGDRGAENLGEGALLAPLDPRAGGAVEGTR